MYRFTVYTVHVSSRERVIASDLFKLYIYVHNLYIDTLINYIILKYF